MSNINYLWGFSVQRLDTKLQPRKKIPYTIIPATSFGIGPNYTNAHKSRLNEIKCDPYKIAQKNLEIRTFAIFLDI